MGSAGKRSCLPRGHWGEVDPGDWKQNDDAVDAGFRIFSVYRSGETTIWIITEADRSSTCVLLPTDY